MLSTVRVSDRPDEVLEAMELIDRAEVLYLQVEELRAMMGEVFQVTCHIHGISPANQPLGWRTMILDGSDLLSTTWIEHLRRIWPFEHEDARLVFCPLATADMRETDQIFFHFIVDYGEREGHPILV